MTDNCKNRRSQSTEDFLTARGWKFKLIDLVPFSEIDLAFSAANPSRAYRRLDNETVQNYAAEMRKGTKFPPVVLLAPSTLGKFPYEVATGMHRINAAKLAGITGLPAYVVFERAAFRREQLSRTINMINGQPPLPNENLKNAIVMWRTYGESNTRTGLSMTHIGEMFNLPPGKLQKEVRIEDAGRRAHELEVSFVSTVQKGVYDALAGIADDDVFKEAARFVNAYTVPVATIEEMCKRIASARSVRARIAVISDVMEAEKHRRQQTTRRGAPRTTPLENLRKNVVGFNRGVEAGMVRIFTDTPSLRDLKSMRAELVKVGPNANVLLAEIDQYLGVKDAAE